MIIDLAKTIDWLTRLACVLMIAVCLPDACAYAADRRPNFVVILADDLGYGDIGAYRDLYPGEDEKPKAYLHTPHLDQLAGEGIRCTRFYATGWCAPSRQALLSGQWVARRSAYDTPWIGRQLRSEGYVTGFFGKSHGARPTQKVYGNVDAQTAEFDDGLFFNGGARSFYLKPGETFPSRKNLEPFPFAANGVEHLTDVFTDHAIDFIRRNAKKPFLLYLPYTAPHDPLQGKPEDLRELFPDTFERMSDGEIRATSRQRKDDYLRDCHYAALVHGLDRSIGRIVQALDDEAIADNTIIVFTSDNGAQHGSNYPLTGHKWDGLEGGIRTPCIIWSQSIASSQRAGTIYDGLASLVDIAPTIWAMASREPYAYPTDGADLMPYLLGHEPPPSERRYLITNACFTFQNSGVDKFDYEFRENQHVMQYVYIEDDEKILCWNPQGTTLVGAVHAKLPIVVQRQDAADILKETTPLAGVTPQTTRGEALFREFVRLVRVREHGLLPTWSGASQRELAGYRWWMLDQNN